MQAKKSQLTDPWAAIDALVKTDPEPTGPEWFTAAQFGERYGYDAATAHNKLDRLVKLGRLRSWKGLASANRRVTTKYRAA